MISTTEEIEFNNEELIKVFDGFKDEFFELRSTHGCVEGYSEVVTDGQTNEWHCSEEYLLTIDRDSHQGFPEKYYSVNMPQLKRKSPEIWMDYVDRVKNRTAELLGAHTSALALFYPPGGFVGWHTNANCSSYQILFTWSETGDGYFRYEDPKTKEIVTLQDKPGWNVRVHYFGDVNEPDDILWHCAYTKCDRFSFAYKYVVRDRESNEGKIILSMIEDTLDEINSSM